MPDLMENSETESAKGSGGSMESEADPSCTGSNTTTTTTTTAVVATSLTATDDHVIQPPVPSPSSEGPFPSIPDSYLRKLQLHSETKERPEHLSEKDVEGKFNSLCLAFKTDRFTLTNRLDLHQRQRDLAEKNVEDELNTLKLNLNSLSQVCGDEETREIANRLHHHLEVLQQSTTRMSSRAEVYGAVQQEERINRAIEVVLMYVENLKRHGDKAAQELEDMRRLLSDPNNPSISDDPNESEDGRPRRTFSVSSSGVGKPGSRRRASIAAVPRSTAERLDGNRMKASMFMMTSARASTCNIGARKCSLQPHSLRPLVQAFQHAYERVTNTEEHSLSPSNNSIDQSDNSNPAIPVNPSGINASNATSSNSCLDKNSVDSASDSANVESNGIQQQQPLISNSMMTAAAAVNNNNHLYEVVPNAELPSPPSAEETCEDENDLHHRSYSQNFKNLYVNGSSLLNGRHLVMPSSPDHEEDFCTGSDEVDEVQHIKLLDRLAAQRRLLRKKSRPTLLPRDAGTELLYIRFTVGGLLVLLAVYSLLANVVMTPSSAPT